MKSGKLNQGKQPEPQREEGKKSGRIIDQSEEQREASYARRAVIRGIEPQDIKQNIYHLKAGDRREVCLDANRLVDREVARHNIRIGTPEPEIVARIEQTRYWDDRLVQNEDDFSEGYAQKLVAEAREQEGLAAPEKAATAMARTPQLEPGADHATDHEMDL